MAGLAALLFQEADSVDAHAPIHRLAHVVDGEQADRTAVSASISTPVRRGIGYFAVDSQVCRIAANSAATPGQCDGVAKGINSPVRLAAWLQRCARFRDIALLGRSGKDEFRVAGSI